MTTTRTVAEGELWELVSGSVFNRDARSILTFKCRVGPGHIRTYANEHDGNAARAALREDLIELSRCAVEAADALDTMVFNAER